MAHFRRRRICSSSPPVAAGGFGAVIPPWFGHKSRAVTTGVGVASLVSGYIINPRSTAGADPQPSMTRVDSLHHRRIGLCLTRRPSLLSSTTSSRCSGSGRPARFYV